MLLTDAEGTPIGIMVTNASPHEVKLIETLLDHSELPLRSRTRLLYDCAADSQSLRESLKQRGIRLIHPFNKRRNQTAPKMTENAKQHYQGRWKVERTFAWLKNLRRLTTRWEHYSHLHQAFWQLGCMFTILKAF